MRDDEGTDRSLSCLVLYLILFDAWLELNLEWSEYVYRKDIVIAHLRMKRLRLRIRVKHRVLDRQESRRNLRY